MMADLQKTALAAANRRLVWRLLLLTAAMFGFGFAMVPIYDVLCEVTGLNGKTGGRVVAAQPMQVDASRKPFVSNSRSSRRPFRLTRP